MKQKVTRPAFLPWTSIMLGISSLFLVLAIISSPEQVFQASSQGLTLWWTIVFPAMLPFLMLSEMLVGFGFVHGLGVLLEPFMRVWYRMPGKSGWVLALGLTAGFPAAAEAARQLEQPQELSDRQQRLLVSLSHFCNPMTIILVIGVGFLHSPSTGYLLVMIHWLSGILSGFIITRMSAADTTAQKRESAVASQHPTDSRVSIPLYRSAIITARNAHIRDGRSFGRLLGETVSHAVQTLMITGGFIIFFAVIVRLLTQYGPFTSLSYLWPSLMEIHLGSYAISQQLDNVQWEAASISAILGFGGLCGWFQVTSLTRPSDMGLLFTLSRFLHSAIAFALTLIVWEPFHRFIITELPAYVPFQSGMDALHMPVRFMFSWQLCLVSILLMVCIIGILLALSLMTSWWGRRVSR